MSEKVFYNESGAFFCDENGILQNFDPLASNVIEENKYKTLIIPEGVRGFCRDFGCGITVTDSFVLPESLEEIGSFDLSDVIASKSNVFAGARLPTVIIPDSVKSFGHFAFGASRMEALCLPGDYTEKYLPYARQFKDSRVKRVYRGGEPELKCYMDCWYKEVYSYESREPGCLPRESTLTGESRWLPYYD